MTARLEIAMLMGGRSGEREVSLAGGSQIAASLRRLGHGVRVIDFQGDLAALARALSPAPDCVFNALHGGEGENGCIQGALEVLRLPYTHSGVLASALAMDKAAAQRVLENRGIACPRTRVVSRRQLGGDDVMKRPYVVKPLAEGSSLGVVVLHEGEDSKPPAPWSYGGKALVQEYIAGRELTVGVLGEESLAVMEITPRVGFYDYRAKYGEGGSRHLLPASLPPAVARKARQWALDAHQALGCRGVSRADFRYDELRGDGGLFMLEVNTQPGMTERSLLPEMAAYAGFSFDALVAWIVARARYGDRPCMADAA